MIILDQTIVNVALPAIQEDLGFSAAGLAWVVNAYLIAFGGLLLLAGRLGDLIGRRTVFLAGLAVFTVGVAAVRPGRSPEMLIAARFVQGVGGALASAVILGMIVTMFPEPGEQAKAIGVFSFVASCGRVDRPAGRRRADRGADLALDLLRQRADRCRRLGAGHAAARAGARPRPARGRRRARRRARDRRADARRLHDRRRALRCRSGAVAVALLVAFVARQARVERPLLRARHAALPQRRRRQPRRRC